jgi:cytidylate kinase
MDSYRTDFSRKAFEQRGFSESCITLTHQTAAGGSSTKEALRKILGDVWRYVSSGAIMRQFADAKGMTIEEFAEYNCKHPEEEWDSKCDERVFVYGMEDEVFVEGHLPHPFVPRAFHVLQTCDVVVRTKRRYRDEVERAERENRQPKLWWSVFDEITKRDKDDVARYPLLYPGCMWSPNDFDLVIDSEKDGDSDTLARIILEKQKEWIEIRKVSDFIRSIP